MNSSEFSAQGQSPIIFFPLDGEDNCITSPFGPRRGVVHSAIDIRAKNGEFLFAITGGTVDGTIDEEGEVEGRYGYRQRDGWRLWITSPEDISTGYMHLKSKPLVGPGDPVTAGQHIGFTGDTGSAKDAPHLHLMYTPAGGNIFTDAQEILGNIPRCDEKNDDDNPERESSGPSTSSTKSIEVVGSIDPNEKVGPNGFGPQGYIKDGQVLVYTVLFENLPAATAEALKVVITDQLDNDLDFTTFKTISSSHLDVLTTDIDTQTGLVTWTFSNINLPPNVNPPEGEGFVTYSINQKQNLPSGTEITNGASIVFDFNLPIVTNQVLNTIDSLAPTSSMQTLTDTQNSQSFTVGWTGTDVDSGIKDFTIFVSQDGGPFTIFRDKTTQTSDVFTGLVGSTYSFFSLTKDNVGNIQVSPTNTVQTTIVSAGVPLQPIIISPADGATITTTDLTIIGTAAAAATVEVFDGASSLGTTTALDDGAWFLSLTLAEGAHTLTAIQTTSGGTSVPSNPINITIDTSGVPATVSGIVFADTNGNGIQDVGESGIVTTVFAALLSDPENGVTVQTDANGQYTIADFGIGSALVQVTVPAGFVPSLGTSFFERPTVLAGTTNTVDFALEPVTPANAATVTGTVFSDDNGNGIQDGVEAGIPDYLMFAIDLLTLDISNSTTDANGVYTFDSITPDPDVTLVQTGFFPFDHTLTSASFFQYLVEPARGSTTTFDVAFHPVQTAEFVTLDFTIYSDNNGNGIRDAGEPPIEGVQVTLFVFTTNQLLGQFSDANGVGTFDGIVPANFVAQVIPTSGTATSPIDSITGIPGVLTAIVPAAGSTFIMEIGIAP